jgi:hypothetical protein
MQKGQRSRLAAGLLLVLLGAAFLAMQIVPGLAGWFQFNFSWPMILVGIGAAILIVGLLTATPDMAVGACVVAGIGGILYYQNQTGDWQSWAYAWALIPGFSGLGQVIAGLLGSHQANSIRNGLGQLCISAILFLIFGSIFGRIFGGFTWLGPYWPLLLVGAGLFIILRALIRRE